jgi:transcriptional regulator with XRE-family HTH domain
MCHTAGSRCQLARQLTGLTYVTSVSGMPIETHRRHLGEQWNEGARLLWVAMRDRGLNQAEVRKLLRGRDGEELSEGAVSRWLYGERRPSLDLAVQIEERFGVPVAAWRRDPDGPAPFEVVEKAPTGTAA